MKICTRHILSPLTEAVAYTSLLQGREVHSCIHSFKIFLSPWTPIQTGRHRGTFHTLHLQCPICLVGSQPTSVPSVRTGVGFSPPIHFASPTSPSSPALDPLLSWGPSFQSLFFSNHISGHYTWSLPARAFPQGVSQIHPPSAIYSLLICLSPNDLTYMPLNPQNRAGPDVSPELQAL